MSASERLRGYKIETADPNSLPPDIFELLRSLTSAAEHDQGARLAGEELKQSSPFLLVSFARDCAVLAVRIGTAALIRNGIIALALEDRHSDWRDTLRTLPLLEHSAKRLGRNFAEMCSSARSFMTGGFRDLLDGYLERTQEERALKCWGWREVESSGRFSYASIPARQPFRVRVLFRRLRNRFGW